MPSNFDAEKRRLLHQKSQQLTTGYGQPNNDTGKDGDIAFRQVEGSGTVQYLKSNDEWVAVSSSGLMPPQRIMVGGGSSSTTGGAGGSTGVTDHGYLTGKDDDDHSQYVHISTTRTITAPHAFTGSPTFSAINIDGGTINGTTIGTDNTQTEWDAAYTHSLDSSQAHSDYLINNGNDVTSGTLQINGTLDLATGSIIDSSGAISFGDENLSTSGTLASGTQTVTGDVTASGTVSAEQLTSTDDLTVADTASIDGTLTLSTGSITDSSGAISFGDENLTTTGIVTAEQLTSTDDATIADTLSVDGTMTLSTGSIIDSSGSIDFGNENLSTDGNVDIDGDLDVDGVTNLDIVDVDGAVDMASTLTVAGVVDITNTTNSSDDSGDTGALRVEGGASIAKKLYVGTDLDVDGVSHLDVVDIDGNVQVDNQTTTIVSGGAISITSEDTITIDSKEDFLLRVADRASIKANTTSQIFFNTYPTNLNNNNYGLNNKASLYHFTTGNGDFIENYTFLSKYEVLESNEFEVYPS